ncbi:hypothetical protein [Streptomyces lydicus]|uniref:hypothetical protein n=1 Tax=Streptomyces lydicus TaxID=47763 RepID=UPI0036ED3109
MVGQPAGKARRAAGPRRKELVWDTGIVGVHATDTKTVHLADAGALTVPGSDLRIVTYTAALGSDAADRLKLLAVIGTRT